MRLADVLDQRDVAFPQRVEQSVAERVVAEHVGEEDGARARRQLRDHLVVVHAERARVDVDEDRREPRVQHGRDVRDPRERRHDHFAGAVAMPKRRQRDQVRRRARVHEHRVPHAEPGRPLLLEERHLLRLGEHRIVGLQEVGSPRPDPRARCCCASAATPSERTPERDGVGVGLRLGKPTRGAACDQVVRSRGDRLGVRRRRALRDPASAGTSSARSPCAGRGVRAFPGAARRRARRSPPMRRRSSSRCRPRPAGRSSRPTLRSCRCRAVPARSDRSLRPRCPSPRDARAPAGTRRACARCRRA